jgi:uncharacterized membrane protein YkoI
MKIMKMRRMIVGMMAVGLVSGMTTWATEENDETVTMAQVPEKVLKTVKQYASEAEIKKIEKGDVDGKMAYEFEIEKGGKKSEVTILPNGKLLSTEEEVALADIPEAAQKAINDSAAAGKPVSTEKVVEKGKTVYEAVVEKGGKKVEITVAPDGKVVATEDVKEAKEGKEGKEKKE